MPQLQGIQNKIRTVEIVFDPAHLEEQPISIHPDRVELAKGQETQIELVLRTLGQDPGGQQATFPMAGFIELDDVNAGVATAKVDDGGTRGSLRVGEKRARSEKRSFTYHVQAEYAGQIYRSSGYPVLLDPPQIDP